MWTRRATRSGGASNQSAQAASAVFAAIGATMRAVWEADQWSARQGGVRWQSIFVVTSDHGHVDVGGHGG